MILKKLLRMTLQNKLFNFDGRIYKNTDGGAIWLNDCPDLFTTKPLLVVNILTSTVSFTTNIKLVWFLFVISNIFNCL